MGFEKKRCAMQLCLSGHGNGQELYENIVALIIKFELHINRIMSGNAWSSYSVRSSAHPRPFIITE